MDEFHRKGFVKREPMSERDRLRQHLVVQGFSGQELEDELDRLERNDAQSG